MATEQQTKKRTYEARQFNTWNKATKTNNQSDTVKTVFIEEVTTTKGTFQTVTVQLTDGTWHNGYLNPSVSKEDFAEAMRLVKAKKK